MTDEPVCASCGHQIRLVNLYGTEFFQHRPRAYCLTWWHENRNLNYTHQAEPKR